MMDKQFYKSNWIRCPLCRSQTRTKAFPDTTLINFPLYCPNCKREIPITLINEELVVLERK